MDYGGRRDAPGRNGDELAFVALAELLQSTAFQAELVALGALAVLSQVKRRKVAPAIDVLVQQTRMVLKYRTEEEALWLTV